MGGVGATSRSRHTGAGSTGRIFPILTRATTCRSSASAPRWACRSSAFRWAIIGGVIIRDGLGTGVGITGCGTHPRRGPGREATIRRTGRDRRSAIVPEQPPGQGRRAIINPDGQAPGRGRRAIISPDGRVPVTSRRATTSPVVRAGVRSPRPGPGPAASDRPTETDRIDRCPIDRHGVPQQSMVQKRG